MQPDKQRFVLEWLHLQLETDMSAGYEKWRNQIGRALEMWDIPFANQLLVGLKRLNLDGRGQAYLRMGQAGLLIKQHDWEKAQNKLKMADSLFSKTSDHVGHTWVLLTLGNLTGDFGNWDEAIDYLERAVALYKQAKDEYGRAQALQNLGAVYYAQSNWAKAAETYRECLDIFVNVGDSISAAMSLSGIGDILTEVGEYSQALECYEASLSIFLEANNLNGQIAVHNNIGRVHDSAGETKKAILHYDESLHLAEAIGDLRSQAIALDNLGVSQNAQKNFEQAHEMHKRALAIYQELGDIPSSSASLNHLGITSKNMKRFSDAEQYLISSQDIKERLGDRRGMASVLVNRAILYALQERWKEMTELTERVFSVAEDISFGYPAAVSHYLNGLWQVAENQLDESAREFANALILGSKLNESAQKELKILISTALKDAHKKGRNAEFIFQMMKKKLKKKGIIINLQDFSFS